MRQKISITHDGIHKFIIRKVKEPTSVCCIKCDCITFFIVDKTTLICNACGNKQSIPHGETLIPSKDWDKLKN